MPDVLIIGDTFRSPELRNEIPYEPAIGGVRLEDLVLVTDDGCEVLTQIPYEMEV